MKQATAILLVFLGMGLAGTQAQTIETYPEANLRMRVEGEGGRNGTAVVWNPKNKLYYTAIAGNGDFPLETFDENGKFIQTVKAGKDLRGMWWNKTQLEANCYESGGISHIRIDNKAKATGVHEAIHVGMIQPDANSVGTYYEKKKEILYLYNGDVLGYSRTTGNSTSTFIDLELPVSVDHINSTTMIFTGIKKKEIGILNPDARKVYLFDLKTGEHTETITLPKSAITKDWFNWSYANGHIFIFENLTRTWTGYKIL